MYTANMSCKFRCLPIKISVSLHCATKVHNSCYTLSANTIFKTHFLIIYRMSIEQWVVCTLNLSTDRPVAQDSALENGFSGFCLKIMYNLANYFYMKYISKAIHHLINGSDIYIYTLHAYVSICFILSLAKSITECPTIKPS